MIYRIPKNIIAPGNFGKDCAYNGERKIIECSCDECDYLKCCIEKANCEDCGDKNCIRKKLVTN